MTIAENIKRIRKEKGLTQQELAEKCGMKTDAQIRQYEREGCNPTIKTLSKIADALDVNVFDIMSTSDIYKQSEKMLKSFNPEKAFNDYLYSIGYEVCEEYVDNKRKIVSITDPDEVIYLSDSEMKKLKTTTKENIDLRMNSYLHDGKHTKK